MSLRVVTFNVGCRSLQEVISFVAETELGGADLILLQEVETETWYNLHDPIIFNNESFQVVFHPLRYTKVGTHGLAVLSKHKLLSIELVELPGFNLLYNSRKRFIQRVKLLFEGHVVEVVNIHLDTRLNWQDRLRQIDPIFKLSSENKILIAGDFNVLPLRFLGNVMPVWFSDQLNKLQEKMFVEGFQGLDYFGHSFFFGPFKWKLDHFFVKDLSLAFVQVLKKEGFSDHFPVLGEVKIINS